MRLIFWCTLLFFSQVQAQANSFDLFEENGKVGLKNEQGTILIPAQYDGLGWTEKNFFVHKGIIGYRKGNLWGLISVQNKIITEPHFATLAPTTGDQIIASAKEKQSFLVKTGCIDISGKTIIPFQYDGIELHGMRAIVYNRNQNKIQFGVINLKNEILIPIQYRSIIPIGNLRFAVENSEGKKALFSDQGKKLTGFSIDKITPFKKDCAILYDGNKQGLIDRNGTIRIPLANQEIKIEEDGSVSVRKPNGWKIMGSDNSILQELDVDSIKILAVNRYALKNTDSVSLVDGDFKPLSNQSFSLIHPFQNENAIFKQAGKFGLIDLNGEILLTPTYDFLLRDQTHFISMDTENGIDQWSVIDIEGKKTNQKTYDKILSYNGNFYPVKKRGYWGAMNTEGKEIISCVFDSLIQIADPYLVVKFHNQYGVIDMEENWRVIPQPDQLMVVHTDRYLQTKGSNTYLKSFTGRIIYFTENPIVAKDDFLEEKISNGSMWRINFDGQIVYRQLPPDSPYEKLFSETEGLRAIKKNGRYGFIDDRGRLRIANRYENAKPYSEKLAAIQILNKWGFIDHAENIIIQPVYESVTSFDKGTSLVKLKGKFGMIDITGKVLITPSFESLAPLSSGRFLATKENLVGLVDKNGNLIIQPKFDGLEDLDNGFVIIKKDEKYGLMTLQGVSTIPLIYDYLSFDAINNRYFGLEKSNWKKSVIK